MKILDFKPYLGALAGLALTGCPDDGEGGTAADGDTTSASTATDTTADEPTGGEPTGGEPTGGDTEGPAATPTYMCPTALASGDELLATATRVADTGGEHDEIRGVVLRIDPDTDELTEVVVAEEDSEFRTLAIAADGGVVVGGASVGFAADGPLLQRYAPDGSLQWTTPLTNAPLHDLALRDDEVLFVDGYGDNSFLVVSGADGSVLQEVAGEGQTTEIEVAADGTIVVAGHRNADFDDTIDVSAAFVRRFDADLQPLWEQQVPAAADGSTVAVDGLALDDDGGAIVSVSGLGGSTVVGQLRKYDVDGNLAWMTDVAAAIEQDVPSGNVNDLIAHPSGGVVAVGRVLAGQGAAFTAAFDAAGAPRWSDVYSDDTLGQLQNTAAADTPGGIAVMGCGVDEDSGTETWLQQLAP